MGRKRKANDGASTEGETETAEPAQTQLQQRMQQSWTNRTRREQEMKRWSCSRLTDQLQVTTVKWWRGIVNQRQRQQWVHAGWHTEEQEDK